MENGRHKVFNFQMSKLDTKIINEKLNKSSTSSILPLKSTLLSVLFFEILRLVIIDISTPKKNHTLFEKSHLLCTKADLITIQAKVENFDIVEQCTQERKNTKWRFKSITNVTIFAALLKNFPMGCPDSVLPEPLLRHTQMNYLLFNKDKEPYKDHLCLFRALAMYMNGHSDLDSDNSRYFTEFVSKSGYNRKSFRGVSVED